MQTNLEKILGEHLTSHNTHVIRVVCDGVKKEKKEKKERYVFTYNDVVSEYGSISAFLHTLNVFSNVNFELVKVYKYGNKTSYRVLKSINKKNNIMEHHATPFPAHSPENSFLGHPQIMQTMLGAARSEDYLTRAKKAENALEDSKSENRILREEVASLKFDLRTTQRESELDFKEKEMNRKGFLETETGGAVIELLSELGPQCLEFFKKKPVAVNALGLPSDISESKRNLIQRISTSSENQVVALNFILQNWTKNLVEKLELIFKEQNGKN